MSHETRAAILQELAAQQRTQPRDPFLSFSALRERVGHHDPGNFNYHLGQLVSRFVVKNADGYRLSHEGQMIVGAMVAHQYNQSNDASLPSVTTRCQTCGETATAHYEEGLFCFECAEGHTFQTGVPATVFEKKTETALIEYISLLTQQQMELALRGVCPYCHGQMSSGIEVTTDEAHAYLFRGTCKHCGVYVCNTVGSCVVRHPAVVGFLYDYGIDVRTEPYWTLDICRDEVTLRSTDPLKLEVAVQREDEELRLTLDEDATVITVERIETATST